MKLTPLDIHHKEFGHSLRGYSEEQVDSFLDEVADEFERLFKENIDMAEKLEAANERVRGYQQIEASINATLLQAQRSSEDIVGRAGSEADSVLRDAELKAKEIIHNALQKKQTIANELIRIKQSEEDFRARYRSMLEDKLHNVDEVELPDDVNVLLGDTDSGVVGDVSVRTAAREAFSAPAPAAAVVPAPTAPTPAATAPGAALFAAYAPDAGSAPFATTPHEAAPFDAAAPAAAPPVQGAAPAEAADKSPLIDPVGSLDMPTISMPPIEPPASGFVQGVSLGELTGPQIEPEVKLVEPSEFNLPGFDTFGEREDDHDIEEID
jgi:cell division initiation protein